MSKLYCDREGLIVPVMILEPMNDGRYLVTTIDSKDDIEDIFIATPEMLIT